MEFVNSCCEDFLKREKPVKKLKTSSEIAQSAEFYLANSKGSVQEKVWYVFEYPQHSFLGRIILYTAGIFILASVVGTVTETVPCPDIACGSKYKMEFFTLEGICVGAFTLEFFARFWAAPSRKTFMKEVLNVIDLVAIIPFYLMLTFLLTTHGGGRRSLKLLAALNLKYFVLCEWLSSLDIQQTYENWD